MINKKELEEKLEALKGSKLNTAEQRLSDDGYYGRSLEESLGVEENNHKNGDLELGNGTRVELKTTNGKSKITLFSHEPIWSCNPKFKKMRQFFDHYSYESTKDGKQRLNMTVSASYRNNRDFKLIVDGDYLIINHETDGNCAKWKLESLLRQADEKLDNLVVVKRSDETIIDSTFSNGFSKDVFKKMISNGQIISEIRLSMKPKGLKNRGTCFRVNPKRITEMYKEEK